MKWLLVSSLLLIAICFTFFSIPQASAVPVIYNQSAPVFGFTSYARNSSVYDVFSSSTANGTINAWYHGTYGGTTMKQIKGVGLSSLTLACAPTQNKMNNARSENSTIYYACPAKDNAGFSALYHINYLTGTKKEDFSNNEGASANQYYIFLSMQIPSIWGYTSGSSSTISTANSGNQSGGSSGTPVYSDIPISGPIKVNAFL